MNRPLRPQNYPLASSSWGKEELRAIQDVIDSGMYTANVHVHAYEKQFAEYFGSKHCIMVNSGSSANLLAVAALFYRKDNPLKAGDEVIVPAVGWSTSYAPLHQYGLKLKFVDVDRHTLNYDLDQLEEAITPATRLILAINLLGNPNDFGIINNLAARIGAIVLEDNCESMGAKYKGKQAGTFGIAGTFSTFFSHHMATMEGGAIVTDDEELYHIMVSLRAHGWTRGLPEDNHIHSHDNDPFQTTFQFVLPGYNVRPLEVEAAIGIEQLKKLPKFIKARQKNARMFHKLFADHPFFDIQKEIEKSSWFGFALTLKDGVNLDRNTVASQLREVGIETRPVVTGNFVRQPVVKYFDYEIHGNLTNADRVHDRAFFVGNHHYDIAEQLKYLHWMLEKV